MSNCIPYDSSRFCNNPRSQPLEPFHPYGTVEGEICHCYTRKNIPKSHRFSLLMDLRVYCHHVSPRSHKNSCFRNIPGLSDRNTNKRSNLKELQSTMYISDCLRNSQDSRDYKDCRSCNSRKYGVNKILWKKSQKSLNVMALGYC